MSKMEIDSLVFQNEGNILKYSMYSTGISVTDLSSAILLNIANKIVPLLPVINDLNSQMLINEFSDEIGEGKSILFDCKFQDINDQYNIPAELQFKIYNSTRRSTQIHGDHSYISIQIFLKDTRNNILLHGYAPLYANGFGSINLSNNSSNNDLSFYSNGWQSWSHNHLNYMNERTPKIPSKFEFFRLLKQMNENGDELLKDRFFSEMHAVIHDVKSYNSFIISFLTHKSQFNRVVMDKLEKNCTIGSLIAYSQTDDIYLSKLNSEITKSEVLMISLVDTPEAYEVLTHHQELVGILSQVNYTCKPEVGWCSWYYYYEDITEEETISNTEFFEENKDIPINLIQLDDGYQTKIGDWGFEDDVFNDKFPRGLRWISDMIHEKGFSSGLWIAPFLAIQSSQILEKHPEWVVLTEKGELMRALNNWREINYSLDLSNPEVLDHVQKMAGVISNRWGYNYLKIDFIYSSALFGSKYFNPNLTRAQILRNGIQAIRNGFGENKMILGCGAPLGPSIGLVDAMRIGVDTAARWSYFDKIIKKVSSLEELALKPALRATIQRSYMHNTLWVNDPDCVIVRENRSKFKMGEIILQLTIFALSGGSVLISDDEKLVSQNRIKLLKRILPPYSPLKGEYDFVLPVAQPLDIFERKLPRLYSRNIISGFGKKHLTAVINWKNRVKSYNYKLFDLMNYAERKNYDKNQRFVVYNYWNEEVIAICTGDRVIGIDSIPKHSCVYLIITPISKDDDFTFVNSTFHVIPGAPEIDVITIDNSKLEIQFNKIGSRAGNLTFYSEKYSQLVTNHRTSSQEFQSGFIIDVKYNNIPESCLLTFVK